MQLEQTIAATEANVTEKADGEQLAQEHENCVDAERRLWTAVLVQAVVEWQSNKVRVSRAAEQFLFENESDFETVCASAGLNPQSFRAQLARVKPKAKERLAFRRLAA
jgi:hypothetical protein